MKLRLVLLVLGLFFNALCIPDAMDQPIRLIVHSALAGACLVLLIDRMVNDR